MYQVTKYFTPEELLAQYESYNVHCYASMANSEEFGRNVLWAPAQGLLQDYIDRAEAALKPESNRAADLRFGHDTGILPLAGLMGLGSRFHRRVLPFLQGRGPEP